MINISRRHVRGVCIFGGSLLVAIILYVAFPFQYRAQHVSRISSFLSSTKLPTNHETLISPVSPNNFTRTSATYSTPNASSQPTVVAIPIQSWEFNHSRDAGGFGLTSEQCNLAFPGLFTEINRAVEYRENIGAVTPKDLDTTWKKEDIFRASIVDQQLYIIEAKFSNNEYNPRAVAILHAIDRALKSSPELLPDIEFTFSDSDIANRTPYPQVIWALTRTEDDVEQWVMSDFGYWSWPLKVVGSYEQVRREIADMEIDFALKKKQVVWRGALKTNTHRKELINVAKGKQWADIKAIEWSGNRLKSGSDVAKALSMPEHCQYQFVLQTEGRSYSGRGKYLHNCNSVVIMHKRSWVEPHHALLVSSGPDQNFVEVEKDFSDLEEKVNELLKDQRKAQRIAQKGVEVFRDRYLTPAAQACYWREMIRGWASISFEPERWEDGSKGNRRPRGTPFETFVIEALRPRKCTWIAKLFLQC